MMFTVPMRLLAGIALEEDGEALTKELLRQGALDYVSIRELGRDWATKPEPVSPRISLARSAELRSRVEGLLALASTPAELPELTADSLAPVDLDASERRLDAVAAEIGALRDRQKALQDEAMRLEEIKRQIGMFDELRGDPAGGSPYSFLAVRTGTLPADRLGELEAALAALPSVLMPASEGGAGRGAYLLVSMKRDEPRVTETLRRAGWEEVELPKGSAADRGAAIRELEGKVERIRSLQGEVAAGLDGLVGGKAAELGALWAGLRINELAARVQSNFSRTRRTLLFSGWIPAERQAEVEAGIRRSTADRCHLEWISPREGEAGGLEAPVELRNPRALAPFQALVTNYAVPEYGAVDPTPFVAVAYLLMFGLMFGDAGQGLVLLVGGLVASARAGRKGGSQVLPRLVAYCGGAAIVAGLLFGSFFGFPLLPPLWFDFHGILAGRIEDPDAPVGTILGILGVAVKFGVATIFVGLVLNWVNLARKRRWTELLLDKGGLLGGWIYGAGVWAASGFTASGYRELPPLPLLLLLFGLPTLALAAKGPIEARRAAAAGDRRGPAPGPLDHAMRWIVEVLEIYSGYLANTLSFMRVAGLGIAHASLMIAFFRIARMIDPEGPFSVAAWAVLVLGNVLVIALEGLSAGIQALRLNYYEFFSKYFNGTGTAYSPVTLRRR